MNLEILSQSELTDYIWNRLRMEGPIRPMLNTRFDDEPPEQFIYQSYKKSKDPLFRKRVIVSIQENLMRCNLLFFWKDKLADACVASLAFLVSLIEETSCIPLLELLISDWDAEYTDGQFHIIRTLAQLKQESSSLWQHLWDDGPLSLYGVIMYGWIRSDPELALSHLSELIDSEGSIDLRTTIWSLMGIMNTSQLIHAVNEPQQERLIQIITELEKT